MSKSLLVNLAFLMQKPTGISTYAVNLFPHLRSLNPTLLSPSLINGYSCYPVPTGMTPEQGTRGHLKRLLWTQFQLPTIYRNLKASLLFSPVTEAPLARDCRYIVTVHDLIALRFLRQFSPLTLYSQSWIPNILNRAEHILCNSIATAQDVEQFYGIASHKLTPIPLAYDAENFRFLDLPTQNYFLYLGRIDPYKNVARLIAAFAALPQHADCELWLAGPPDPRYLPSLQAQVEQLHLENQVRFLDYIPYEKLPGLLNQAIALVFPTLWEGFGIPVLEAMACGTPVITSNLASLPEVAGDAALLIDPYQVGAIADAMHTLLQDAQLRATLRKAGLQRASQFSWAKTGQATAEVLQQYL